MSGQTKHAIQQFLELNVNDITENKQGQTYLSWAHAWKQVLLIDPDATYNILRDESGRCYFGDPEIGYMVYTTVTIDDLERMMWLPVMDGANKAMKLNAYSYKVKSGEKEVGPISMFEINKTAMRCLTKNLAMFGLGLYIYAGEDVPEIAPVDLMEKEARKLYGDLRVSFKTKYGDSGQEMLDDAVGKGTITEVGAIINSGDETKLSELCDILAKVGV